MDETRALIREALAQARDRAARNRAATIRIQECADLVAGFYEYDLADQMRCLVADLRIQADALDGFSDREVQ